MSNDIQIKKQVEFYFSNANLRVDKFLQLEMKKNSGWIDASVLLTFNKLKLLNATEDKFHSILEDSSVVEIKKDTTDNKTYIRKVENEDYLNYLKDESIEERIFYIKGFSVEATYEEIEEYLAKSFEFVLMRMVHDRKKVFTGAVFVELKNKDDVEKVANMKILVLNNAEVVKKRKVEGREGIENYLLIKSKKDFIEEQKSKKKELGEEILKKEIINEFMGKFYKYECSKEADIKSIKKLVEGAAFVDLKSNILRFKNIMDFDAKEYEEDGLSIKIKKLDEEESNKYAQSIKFTSIGNKTKKKRISKK